MTTVLFRVYTKHSLTNVKDMMCTGPRSYEISTGWGKLELVNYFNYLLCDRYALHQVIRIDIISTES